MAEASALSKLPIFNFGFHPSISSFSVNQQEYVKGYANGRFDVIGTGALVFDLSDSTTPRILLVQRSASDSMPNKWEVPGGACDDEDESVLHAVARELWEEAGLEANHISSHVGDPHFFSIRSGKMTVCKFNFVVQVASDAHGKTSPKLNPEEHQQFVWASESDVRSRKVDDIALEFTARQLEQSILLAFSQLNVNGKSGAS